MKIVHLDHIENLFSMTINYGGMLKLFVASNVMLKNSNLTIFLSGLSRSCIAVLIYVNISFKVNSHQLVSQSNDRKS